MYKKSILIAALISGVCASENPFAIEKNVQKIEQEEGALLQAIAKEQKTFEDEEDSLFEESISPPKASKAVKGETKAHSRTEIAQEPEVQKREEEANEERVKEVVASKVEETAPPVIKQEKPAASPVKETLKKPQLEQEKKANVESPPEEVAPKESVPVVAKAEETPPSSPGKASENSVKNEAQKEVQKNKSKDIALPKEETKKLPSIREIADKPELEAANKVEAVKVQPSAEKKIEKVDTKVKKAEEKKPKQGKVKPATHDGISASLSTEANTSAENDITFEQKLKEAIRSVQD